MLIIGELRGVRKTDFDDVFYVGNQSKLLLGDRVIRSYQLEETGESIEA